MGRYRPEAELSTDLVLSSVIGHFIPPNEAYLTSLYEHPGFEPIRQLQESRQAREREKFLAAVCTENPYAAVWQPAEGTCER